MIEQRSLSIRITTYDYFLKVKIQYQAKVKTEKELTHDEFLLKLLKYIINKEGLKIE